MSDEAVVKKEKKPLPPSVKKVLFQVLGYIVSILPILVVVGLNWNEYTKTTTSTVSLCVGGVIALVLILIKAIGKMPKKIHPIIKYAVALVLVVALDALVQDLKLLLAAAIVGEVLDLPIEYYVNKLRLQINQQATLNAMDDQTKKIVNAINNGRV